MKQKITLFLSALLIATTGLFAQKNVVKIKPLRPGVAAGLGAPISLPLAYERVIIPRLSAQINFTYQLNGGLDLAAGPSVGDLGITAPSISSWGLGPEVRFYPNIVKSTPRGFYLMGYFNYTKTSISSDYSYSEDLDFNGYTVPYSSTLNLEGYLNRTAYGVGIGSQWLIADVFALDILWFGLGWGGANIGADIDGPLVDEQAINQSLAAQGAPVTITSTTPGVPTWQSVADKFDSDLADFDIPVIEPELTASSSATGANFNINANLPNLRLFNFSIGFAF